MKGTLVFFSETAISHIFHFLGPDNDTLVSATTEVFTSVGALGGVDPKKGK